MNGGGDRQLPESRTSVSNWPQVPEAALQVAPGSSVQPPAVHVKVALPVLGAVESVAVEFDPMGADATVAVQTFAPTVQMRAVELQVIEPQVSVLFTQRYLRD